MVTVGTASDHHNTRRTKQKLVKRGITPVPKAGTDLRPMDLVICDKGYYSYQTSMGLLIIR
jgi:hypothetical protein